MCGISGIISKKDPSQALPQWAASMSDLLRHRGPDGEGFLGWGKNLDIQLRHKNPKPDHLASLGNLELSGILAHRRLSIIDLSEGGSQPFSDNEANLHLTYNGEIYNYLELRDELVSLGFVFHTQSDTEVLLAAYKAWGWDCLDKLNGMFAFVLADLNAGELWIVRDRVGVKPLYYLDNDGFFAFASEIKAFFCLPFAQKKINYTAAYDYFVLNVMERDELTLFDGIKELLPGGILKINLRDFEMKVGQWFHPPSPAPWSDFSQRKFKDAVEQVREKVTKSIQLRLRSDVQVGSCLSGGMDSSSIVSIASALKQKSGDMSPMRVFTSCYENPRYDERKYAARVVAMSQSLWHQVFPTQEEFVADIGQMMYGQDLPTMSASTYSQWRVMRLAKEQGIKVLLDGQGGDELFSGYAHHHLHYMNNLLALGKVGELARDDKLKSWIKHILKQKAPKWLMIRWKLKESKTFLQDDFIYEHRFRAGEFLESKLVGLNQRLSHEFYNGPLKHLLRCEDRAGMWHSIESRTPFADDIELAGLVHGLSASLKTVKGESKALLRAAMKGIVPDEVLTRKDKMGFSSPNNEWLRQSANSFLPLFENADPLIFNRKRLNAAALGIMNPEDDVENYSAYKYPAFMAWAKAFGV